MKYIKKGYLIFGLALYKGFVCLIKGEIEREGKHLPSTSPNFYNLLENSN